MEWLSLESASLGRAACLGLIDFKLNANELTIPDASLLQQQRDGSGFINRACSAHLYPCPAHPPLALPRPLITILRVPALAESHSHSTGCRTLKTDDVSLSSYGRGGGSTPPVSQGIVYVGGTHAKEKAALGWTRPGRELASHTLNLAWIYALRSRGVFAVFTSFVPLPRYLSRRGVALAQR